MNTELNQSTVNTITVKGSKVYYIDGMMTSEEVVQFSKIASSLSFNKAERSHEEDEYLSFRAEFLTSKFADQIVVGKLANSLMSRLFPENNYKLYRAYLNMSNYGDVEYSHTDCGAEEKDITILYYAHGSWNKDWGGETFFYDGDDVKAAISPIPGRFLIFPGAIEHVGTVPTRICKNPRFSLVMKYKLGNN